jgi:hypothetical protein
MRAAAAGMILKSIGRHAVISDLNEPPAIPS